VIAAGGLGDSDFISALVPDVFWKAAATSRASTTTLADDPDLTTTLAANAVYWVQMWLHFVSQTTPLIQTAWTVPSGATGNRGVIGPGSSSNQASSDNVSGRFGVHGFATSIVYGTRGATTNQLGCSETAVVFTSSSSGTLALQWAQNTSNATASQMSAGSVMLVKRLA
jgi:hypothetical protein